MLKYPSIVSLDKMPDIFLVKEVVGIEKLHGTNMRLLVPSGSSSIDGIQYGSRNEEFGTAESGSFYGGRPVGWFKSQPKLLQTMLEVYSRRYGTTQDITLYGEICGSGIQKGISYTVPGEVIFRAFDIRVGEDFINYDEFVEVCDEIGIPRCKEVWRGAPSLAAFDALLGQNSQEGITNGVDNDKNISEGVVIRSIPLIKNHFGEYVMFKHKNDKFKEQTQPRKKDEPNKDIAETFSLTYVTRGRISNVLGHLRDSGLPIIGQMEDMRYLSNAIHQDIFKECEVEWQEAIEKGTTSQQLKSNIAKIATNLYRRMLIEDTVT